MTPKLGVITGSGARLSRATPFFMSGIKICLGLAILVGLNALAGPSDAPVGVIRFTDRHNPPPYRFLGESEAARANLGRSLFDTQWIPASAVDTPGRHGLGPLFNAVSCATCHIDGAGAHGPTGDGPLPIGLVIQLASGSADVGVEPAGDPVYGRVFNAAAVEGVKVEGVVSVRYREIVGYYYPDGIRWHLRKPDYRLTGLAHGPLAPTTVIKPRLAPALFGVGLLDAVPEAAISGRNSGTAVWYSHQGKRMLGRFGWQGQSVSTRDQTTKALAHEMGVTSSDRDADDCTPSEADCLKGRISAAPEISDDLLDAVVAFLRTLAVPESPLRADDRPPVSSQFTDVGCGECHLPRLPVELPGSDGAQVPGIIAPYTDLRLHDLGMAMADETTSGTKVTTKWRTAPLWGLGYRMKVERYPTFLHDGRARSVEEAILWHSGEAASARNRFMKLGPRSREALLRWLETL